MAPSVTRVSLRRSLLLPVEVSKVMPPAAGGSGDRAVEPPEAGRDASSHMRASPRWD